MSNIYRFTGPPENWITGIGLKRWAVNENNVGLWNKLQPGDVALLHSTTHSSYSNSTKSAVIGYAVIAAKKWIKDEHWWVQEVSDGKNYWPYVFTMDEIYLFGGDLPVDFQTQIQDKSEAVIKAEVEALSGSGITLQDLNARGRQLNPEVPAFPVNGSASGVNPIYEEILLQDVSEFYAVQGTSESPVLNERMDEVLDEQISQQSLDNVVKEAASFTPTTEGYVEKNGVIKLRKDNEAQKRRVARIENYTCQVCGFYCEYIRKNGKTGWIINVDHILDKHKGGTELLENLWVLCPNCHNKKTRGIIQVDTSTKTVTEDGKPVSIKDHHLNW